MRFPATADHQQDTDAIGVRRLQDVQREVASVPMPVNHCWRRSDARMEINPERAEADEQEEYERPKHLESGSKYPRYPHRANMVGRSWPGKAF